MSIFLNKDSKVIVQGITGGEGTKHTALMLKAGTQVVGGVNARKAGTTVSHTDAAGVDATDDLGAGLQHEGRVLGALAAGDALDDDLGVLVEEDRHFSAVL
jgi:succinyl-CoA synthetase alpha subunit